MPTPVPKMKRMISFTTSDKGQLETMPFDEFQKLGPEIHAKIQQRGGTILEPFDIPDLPLEARPKIQARPDDFGYKLKAPRSWSEELMARGKAALPGAVAGAAGGGLAGGPMGAAIGGAVGLGSGMLFPPTDMYETATDVVTNALSGGAGKLLKPGVSTLMNAAKGALAGSAIEGAGQLAGSVADQAANQTQYPTFGSRFRNPISVGAAGGLPFLTEGLAGVMRNTPQYRTQKTLEAMAPNQDVVPQRTNPFGIPRQQLNVPEREAVSSPLSVHQTAIKEAEEQYKGVLREREKRKLLLQRRQKELEVERARLVAEQKPEGAFASWQKAKAVKDYDAMLQDLEAERALSRGLIDIEKVDKVTTQGSLNALDRKIAVQEASKMKQILEDQKEVLRIKAGLDDELDSLLSGEELDDSRRYVLGVMSDIIAPADDNVINGAKLKYVISNNEKFRNTLDKLGVDPEDPDMVINWFKTAGDETLDDLDAQISKKNRIAELQIKQKETQQQLVDLRKGVEEGFPDNAIRNKLLTELDNRNKSLAEWQQGLKEINNQVTLVKSKHKAISSSLDEIEKAEAYKRMEMLKEVGVDVAGVNQELHRLKNDIELQKNAGLDANLLEALGVFKVGVDNLNADSVLAQLRKANPEQAKVMLDKSEQVFGKTFRTNLENMAILDLFANAAQGAKPGTMGNLAPLLSEPTGNFSARKMAEIFGGGEKGLQKAAELMTLAEAIGKHTVDASTAGRDIMAAFKTGSFAMIVGGMIAFNMAEHTSTYTTGHAVVSGLAAPVVTSVAMVSLARFLMSKPDTYKIFVKALDTKNPSLLINNAAFMKFIQRAGREMNPEEAQREAQIQQQMFNNQTRYEDVLKGLGMANQPTGGQSQPPAGQTPPAPPQGGPGGPPQAGAPPATPGQMGSPQAGPGPQNPGQGPLVPR